MSSRTSTLSTLAVAALVAVAASVTLTRLGTSPDVSTAKMAAARAPQWSATAPGRVEPRHGEIKLSSQTAGRLVELAARVNDAVTAGDLLARVDDEEIRARLVATEAEAGVRKRERDQENAVGRAAQDRRQAEDNVATAERALHAARAEFDRVLKGWTKGERDVAAGGVSDSRKAVAIAKDKVESERAALRRAQNVANIPLPTRLEAGLANARSELSQSEAAYERARIRAPIDGVILQIIPHVGELIAANPEQPVLSIGDLSVMRVRAELEERDVSKVRTGQNVVVRTDAHPSRDFTGKVARISKTMAASKISQRGPRRPNDFDALEVMIEMDPTEALLPGMRVDVLFKPDAAAASTGPAPAMAASSATPAKSDPKAEAKTDAALAPKK